MTSFAQRWIHPSFLLCLNKEIYCWIGAPHIISDLSNLSCSSGYFNYTTQALIWWSLVLKLVPCVSQVNVLPRHRSTWTMLIQLKKKCWYLFFIYFLESNCFKIALTVSIQTGIEWGLMSWVPYSLTTILLLYSIYSRIDKTDKWPVNKKCFKFMNSFYGSFTIDSF